MDTFQSKQMYAFQSVYIRRQCGPLRKFVFRSSFQEGIEIPLDTSHHHIGIFGAGAAGLTAAYFAAKKGLHVNLYEKTSESGNKIRISGGSRCNILPGSVSIENDFFSESKIGCLRAIFGQWDLEECRKWIENDIGIALKYEDDTDKVFPASNSGREVRDRLLQQCLNTGNVKISYSKDICTVTKIEIDSSLKYRCEFSDGTHAIHERIVLATGGLSFPLLGTSGAGYSILSGCLNHTLRPPYPALTPLKGIIPGHEYELSGVSLSSVDLSVSIKPVLKEQKPTGKKKRKTKQIHAERKDILFTHRGYSGPSILDLSHYYTMAEQRDSLQLPEYSISWNASMSEEAWTAALQSHSKMKAPSLLRRVANIPARLAKALCDECGISDDKILAELRKEEKSALVQRLVKYRIQIHGHEGYAKAEVTGGGIPLEEIDCSTMESRLNKNVYIIGELCDIHGRIGGFNFLFAWYSGRLAGNNV